MLAAKQTPLAGRPSVALAASRLNMRSADVAPAEPQRAPLNHTYAAALSAAFVASSTGSPGLKGLHAGEVYQLRRLRRGLTWWAITVLQAGSVVALGVVAYVVALWLNGGFTPN
jgi:CubicO group peptidase (beta-lactamase class C family)